MKVMSRITTFLLISLVLFTSAFASSHSEVACGDTITENTTLTADLVCPEGTDNALIIGASNLTLDLGGHVISGHLPGIGIFSMGQEGITIRNGTLEGFHPGIFFIQSNLVTMENLTIRNMDSSDPDDLVLGISILDSQDVIVRDSLFEFPSVAHKEAVEVYESYVDVRDIEVRGGGAGVNFSFAGECDPVNRPSNGTVTNSRFSNVYIAGIEIACSSYAWIENNVFTADPPVGIGIQADGWIAGDVTGMTIQNNYIYDTLLGIEFRGISDSDILNNYIFDNQIWGIAIRESLGCLVPESGLECFYSTDNQVDNNKTWGNGMDLYHYEYSTGNTWTGNTCETSEGAEIPPCSSLSAALAINYTSGKPGSFFTLRGANFPSDSTAIITINGYTLGTVPTDSSGDLIFLLDTNLADEGEYLVNATVNPSASVTFWLDSNRFTRLQEGSGTVFEVPSGLVPHLVFLPLILR